MIVLLSSFHPNFQIQQQNLCNCHLYKPKKIQHVSFFLYNGYIYSKNWGQYGQFSFCFEIN